MWFCPLKVLLIELLLPSNETREDVSLSVNFNDRTSDHITQHTFLTASRKHHEKRVCSMYLEESQRPQHNRTLFWSLGPLDSLQNECSSGGGHLAGPPPHRSPQRCKGPLALLCPVLFPHLEFTPSCTAPLLIHCPCLKHTRTHAHMHAHLLLFFLLFFFNRVGHLWDPSYPFSHRICQEFRSLKFLKKYCSKTRHFLWLPYPRNQWAYTILFYLKTLKSISEIQIQSIHLCIVSVNFSVKTPDICLLNYTNIYTV